MQYLHKKSIMDDIKTDSTVSTYVSTHLNSLLDICDLVKINASDLAELEQLNTEMKTDPNAVDLIKRGMNKAFLFTSNVDNFVLVATQTDGSSASLSFVIRPTNVKNDSKWKFVPINVRVNLFAYINGMQNSLEFSKSNPKLLQDEFKMYSDWSEIIVRIIISSSYREGKVIAKNNFSEDERQRNIEMLRTQSKISLITPNEGNSDIANRARDIELALLETGAIPGVDYSFLDLISAARKESYENKLEAPSTANRKSLNLL
jgi:hypothetical protein